MNIGEEPGLSVVLPSKSRQAVVTTLEHLRAQTIQARIELLVVTESKERLALEAADLQGFRTARVVEIGPFEQLSDAFAAGIRAATEPVVALAENHAYPESRWAEAMIERHREPWAAVGPAMVCANPESMLGWADMVMAFGRWLEQDEAMEVDRLPGHNSSYKRDVLLAYGDALDELIEIEFLLHDDLRRHGHRLYFEPAARTRHVNITRPSSWISNRLLAGWVFAVLRSQSWSPWRRLLYVLASPLLPAVRLWRIVPDLRRIGRRHRLVPRVLPALAAGLVIESAGEALGYALGRHVRVVKPLDVEMDRLRHVRGSRQHASYQSSGARLQARSVSPRVRYHDSRCSGTFPARSEREPQTMLIPPRCGRNPAR